MRNAPWIIAIGLAAASTAGCVDMNSPYGGGSGYGYAPGYSSGYSQGYAPVYSGGYGYAPNYYRPPAVNNYYVQPQPQVVTNTRYVPVPTPSRQWGNNNGPDHRGDNDHHGNNNNNPGQAQGQPGDHRPQQHDWHPAGGQQAGNQPAPAPRAPTPTPQQPRPPHGPSQDHDGNGQPGSH